MNQVKYIGLNTFRKFILWQSESADLFQICHDVLEVDSVMKRRLLLWSG
jgi:hypothetical protein